MARGEASFSESRAPLSVAQIGHFASRILYNGRGFAPRNQDHMERRDEATSTGARTLLAGSASNSFP